MSKSKTIDKALVQIPLIWFLEDYTGETFGLTGDKWKIFGSNEYKKGYEAGSHDVMQTFLAILFNDDYLQYIDSLEGKECLKKCVYDIYNYLRYKVSTIKYCDKNDYSHEFNGDSGKVFIDSRVKKLNVDNVVWKD